MRYLFLVSLLTLPFVPANFSRKTDLIWSFSAPVPPDSLELILPDDLQATLWAESPLFYNPTNMDVDSKGRIWVTEAVNYRDFNNKPAEHLSHPQGDRVMILEDTDGDGKADKSKMFVQDKDLVAPLGIAVIGNQVIVSCAPSLIIYTDTNGDDTPDKKEVFLTGFGGFDHDHSLHSVIAGPDGNWYFNTGNAGPHLVTDKAGWNLRSGSIYTGGTPYNTKNQGNQKSDDGKTWVGGLALRVGKDGKGLQVLAHNFRNAYELAVDSYGNMWQNDNDDQVVTCRVTWLMEGGNAGYFSADGTRFWQADKRPGQDIFTAHWHQEDPGVIPAGDNSGAGSPTGVAVYEGDALGAQYRGMLLSADAGRNVIFGYKPEAKGAGYQLNRTNFITSLKESTENYVWNDKVTDMRKWFRPSDVAVGADGAIYVADWYDAVVGGHQMHDKEGYGRIFRITPKNQVLQTPKIDLSTTKGQIDALKNPAINVRNAGFVMLQAKGAKAVKPVKKLLESENPYYQARAVWLLSKLGDKGVKEVEKLLTHPTADIRITAFRALRQARPEQMLSYSSTLATDVSAAVRREVAVALRDVPLEKKQAIVAELVKGYDGEDRWYLEALGITLQDQESAYYPELLKNADTDPVKWDKKTTNLVWRLHPVASVDAWKKRANATELSPEQRKQALVSLGFIKDKSSAEVMVELTKSELSDVSEQAYWWVKFRKSNDWLDLVNWEETLPDELLATREMMQLQAQAVDLSKPKTSREEAAAQMAKDKTGGQMLISLAAEKKLPDDLKEIISNAIFSNPDQTVRVLAGDYFTKPGAAKTLSIKQISSLQPDITKGKLLFQNNCASCHKRGKTGGEIGPDLSQIHKKFDKTALLDAIINPSAGLAFGYEPWLIKTKKGSSFYGFLIADDATVVLRDVSGQQHVIKAADVESRKQFSTSLMPDPLAMGLTEKDLADLAQFLLSMPQE
ncbi:c-type cytochrome [Rhodocytophaga rosea]|uniref:C-type cytochrome n=1 Tax=Rhodocytophaga rosea TaxID=2704465 RepID=A0A6C0GR03_9BACT|nr:PVC-type heme-binding CxxCH protein [Rhodocytophaga rosea]QHT70043.1 c-type cytochrome [Rhodocytophaga rosea]